jgi:hypothetical protein
MSNQVIEFDIEVFTNLFQIGIKDFRSKKVTCWEVTEFQDDRIKIVDFFKKYDGYLISFNGIHYDEVIISFLLKEWNVLKNLENKEFCLRIKQFSDLVIHSEDNYEKVKKYKWFDKKWTSVDLYNFWSKMLRISKKISLKSLGIQLNYPVVQELPYNEKMVLTKEQIDVVRNYNNVHDLGILDMLAERMKEDISLRIDIKKQYGLECLSWDAIKIASEALLQDYCKSTFTFAPGTDNETAYNEYIRSVRNLIFTRPTIYIKDILRDFNPDFKLPIFQNLYKEILDSVDSFSKELDVVYGNTKIRLSYGVGGIHTLNKNEMYDSNDKEVIMTSDVTSLYPNLIINYNCVRFPEVLQRYKDIKKERTEAKSAGRKKEDTFKKLILNGFSGLLDQEVSWLYYPEGALRLRLIGQLLLTKVIEVCLLNNWRVISTNTDGIESIVPIDELDKYYTTIEEVGKQFNVLFEHDQYEFIYYTHVNAYIAKTKKGKLKKKGFYKTKEEVPLGDSVDELIIPLALERYFVNNIPIEETITNPKKYGWTIDLYCCSKKVSKDYAVYYNGEIVQNLNRYYFNKSAPYLLKLKKEGAKKRRANATFEHLNAGDPVILYNEHVDKSWEEYDINYNSYISRTRKIINELKSAKNQLTLF